jgi:aminocarboxymuconate-semialdehyde decarboxylase
LTPLIDVHCHVVPKSFPEDPTGGSAPWPSVRCAACQTKAEVFMGDRAFRAIDDRSWDPARRIADMDADGVTLQVLSPMPELLSYWLPPEASSAALARVNETIASMVQARPDRFAGLGAVPLQDPELAARDLGSLKRDLGLRGVEVGSNVLGAYLGDPRFEPFFAAAEAEGMAVFVHALHPISGKDVSPMLAPFAAFPVDTALCAASLIMAGVLERYPNLRIGFSHGGGALAPLIHRMEFGWSATKGFDGRLPQSPKAYARKLYLDSLVYDGAYLAHLTELAPGRVFLGTDYPYLIQQPHPRAFLEEAGAPASAFAAAAQSFLGLPHG